MYQTVDDKEAITEIESAGVRPGGDLVCRIERLTDDGWKEIDSKIDCRLGGFFVSGANGTVLPWRGEHQLAGLSMLEMDHGIDTFEVSPERAGELVCGRFGGSGRAATAPGNGSGFASNSGSIAA